MFKRMKLGTKLMMLVLSCVIVPAVVTLVVTGIKGKAIKVSVNAEIYKMSDSDLAHIAEGIYETIDQAVRAAIRLNCLSLAKNAEKGSASFIISSRKAS